MIWEILWIIKTINDISNSVNFSNMSKIIIASFFTSCGVMHLFPITAVVHNDYIAIAFAGKKTNQGTMRGNDSNF